MLSLLTAVCAHKSNVRSASIIMHVETRESAAPNRQHKVMNKTYVESPAIVVVALAVLQLELLDARGDRRVRARARRRCRAVSCRRLLLMLLSRDS